MTNQERMALLMAAYNTLFESKRTGSDITQMVVQHPNLMTWDGKPAGQQNGRWFKDGLLRGFDLNINLGNKIIKIRILEQNPNTASDHAKMAQNGARIAWVIDNKVQKGGWLGRIQDGVWHVSKPRATYPATYRNSGTGPVETSPTEEVVDISELPEIPNGVGIPDAVLHAFANEEVDDEPQY